MILVGYKNSIFAIRITPFQKGSKIFEYPFEKFVMGNSCNDNWTENKGKNCSLQKYIYICQIYCLTMQRSQNKYFFAVLKL